LNQITPNEEFPDYAVNRTIYEGKVYEEPYKQNFAMLDSAFRRLLVRLSPSYFPLSLG
jgi:hypothetical protein